MSDGCHRANDTFHGAARQHDFVHVLLVLAIGSHHILHLSQSWLTLLQQQQSKLALININIHFLYKLNFTKK